MLSEMRGLRIADPGFRTGLGIVTVFLGHGTSNLGVGYRVLGSILMVFFFFLNK